MEATNLIMVNRGQWINWINPKMNAGLSVVFKKGKIDGYDYAVNMEARCVETGEKFHFIWQDESIADTDSCSIGELL